MTSCHATPTRWFVAVVGALALVLSGATTARAQTPQPPPAIPVGTFCANVPAGFDPFEDIAGTTFEPHIRCLAAAGVTAGVGPGSPADPRDAFAPSAQVTRQQMASFIVNLMDTAHSLSVAGQITPLPTQGVPPFGDVAADNPHAESISRLLAAGIVEGGPGDLEPDSFGPREVVNRGQMASFIHGAHEFMLGIPLEADETYFTDTAGNVHEPSIDAVAANAIAVGFGDGTYRPDLPVTRGQMAGFLARTLATLEAADRIGVLPPGTGRVDVSVEPTCVPLGGRFTVVATGLEPGAEYSFLIDPVPESFEAGARARADEDGRAELPGVISMDVEPGTYTWRIVPVGAQEPLASEELVIAEVCALGSS